MWPFGSGKSKRGAVVNPPVDLDTPVANPALVAAFDQHVAAPTDETQYELIVELGRANYLVATLDDQSNVEHDARQGTIKKGSRIAVLLCANDKGQTLVPLFTDWDEIKAYTTNSVSALVMPAEEAWEFVTSQSMYDGAVINPANWAVELSRDQIASIEQLDTSLPPGARTTADARAPAHHAALVDLLDRVQDDPDLRVEIYGVLTGSTLVIGSREPPPTEAELEAGGSQAPVTLLTTISPDGRPALPVFTDAGQLHARNGEAHPITMRSDALFAMAIEDGYDGVVLNPASNWIYIPREHIEGFSLHA